MLEQIDQVASTRRERERLGSEKHPTLQIPLGRRGSQRLLLPHVIYWRKGPFSSELFSECEFDPMTILPDLLIEHESRTTEVAVTVRAASPMVRPRDTSIVSS